MATVDPTFYRTAADAAAAPAATDVPGLGNELRAQARGPQLHQIRLQGGDASSDSYCYR
jgi:hypothetical protein